MDTELKKYKRDTFKRVIAVLICLLCISGMSNQALTSLAKAEEENLVYVNFSDALNYELLGVDKNEWTYTSFRNGYVQLISQLERKMNEYGNGTEKDYKRKLKEYKENLEKETDFYKDRIIYAATTHFSEFATLYNSGIITIESLYAVEETEDMYGDNIEYRYSDFNPDNYRNRSGVVEEPTLPLSVSQQFKNAEYDNVFYNDCVRRIYDDEVEGAVIAKYNPGYYAFKVNREELKKQLLSTNAIKSYYGSYEEFHKDYLQNEKEIKAHAGSAKYFIRDAEGNTITNIKNLGEKSKEDEIHSCFEKLGTYSFSKDGAIYLSDGLYYSDTYLDWFIDNDYYAYQNESYTAVVHTTMPDVTKAAAETTAAGITNANGMVIGETHIYVNEYGDEVTVPETTRVSVSLIEEHSITASDIELYIGFDKNAEFESCHFASFRSNIEKAEEIIEDCLFTWGILGTVLLLCIIYLIAITGRRKGSRGIHLYSVDRLFPEIRTVIDGGLGFLCGLGILYFLDIYVDSMMKKTVGLCILVLVILFFLICLDLVLYLVRQIKNRSLLKNIFIVWLIRKLMKYGKAAKNFINGKILYTKELKKTVLIRTAIMLGINILVGGAVILFGAGEVWALSLLLVFVLFLFDLYIIYRGLRFVGGTNKLFDVIREMHEGNTDVHIDKNALPPYLYLPAEDLQCLSEGIKAAVDEAVRQEKTKTELITNVSHDLKTPLTSIINYVDLMKKCDITDETALSYLQVLGEKSDRLKVLIEDLVEASKASAGALAVDFVCVSCKELISQLVGEFEEAFEQKRLDVIVSVPEKDVKLRADSKHIYRVLENLLVNVRKYALECTRVYITVSENGDKGIINIKNISAAPLNISADELKERFVRGEQSRTTEGNGLGLSIAENLCTLQNGSLGIEINGDLFSVTVELEKFI